MLEHHASTMSEFIDALHAITNTWYPKPEDAIYLWHRGQPRASDLLVPTLFREEIARRAYNEDALFHDWQALVQLPLDVRPSSHSPWEWYFMARHYGLPSRLLDWTENPLAALWFAISSKIANKRELHQALTSPREDPSYTPDSPAVWVLDASTLNSNWLGADDQYIFHVGGDFTAHYLPEELAGAECPAAFEFDGRTCTNEFPIAIYPARRTPRILVQQGVFTLHGYSSTPIEDLAPSADPSSCIRLARILLDSNAHFHLFDELETLGINRYALFPDPDSLSAHLMWTYWSAPCEEPGS